MAFLVLAGVCGWGAIVGKGFGADFSFGSSWCSRLRLGGVVLQARPYKKLPEERSSRTKDKTFSQYACMIVPRFALNKVAQWACRSFCDLWTLSFRFSAPYDLGCSVQISISAAGSARVVKISVRIAIPQIKEILREQLFSHWPLRKRCSNALF